MVAGIRVVKTGRELRLLGAKAFMDFINPIILEKALINMDAVQSLAEEKKWLDAQAKAVDAGAVITVLLLEGKKVVGNCEARRGKWKEKHNVHFGIAISKEYRGQGWGEKMLSTAFKEAKKSWKPHGLWIEYLEGNTRACALYEKLGFKEFGRLHEYERHNGRWLDKVLMRHEG